MSNFLNFLLRRLCLRAGALFIASAWLVNNGYSQQSSGGIFSLGISDDARVRFSWRPNTEPDLAGYKLYVGTLPDVYSGFVDVGMVTTFELPDLLRGMTYYFALTAYNTAGVESDFTPELTYQIPLIPLVVQNLLSATNEAQASQLAQVGTNNAPLDSETLLNSPPVISDIPDQLLSKNRASGPIPITVSDIDTSAADLEVVAYSSNPLVLPLSGLTLAGSGSNRTLVIDPLNGQTGVSVVTIAVTDGSSITTMSFQITVEHGTVATQVVAPIE